MCVLVIAVPFYTVLVIFCRCSDKQISPTVGHKRISDSEDWLELQLVVGHWSHLHTQQCANPAFICDTCNMIDITSPIISIFVVYNFWLTQPKSDILALKMDCLVSAH